MKAHILIICLFLVGCRYSSNKMTLKKVTDKGFDRIDTLITIDKDSYVLGVSDYATMGRFKHYYVALKIKDQKKLFYKVLENGLSGRISKDYIGLADPSVGYNWGWFYIANGKIQSLPNLTYYLDSLKKEFPLDCFIQETNGIIKVNQNGATLKEIHYGEILMPKTKIDYNNLPYKLYSLQNGMLVTISDNIDDFFKKDGINYVPKPGYGVRKKISIKHLFHTLDSVIDLPTPPNFMYLPDN